MPVRLCWTCKQPATHALTRDGSIPLDACDNCTRIDQAEAETRGWTIQPIGGEHSTANVEPGVRVSGEVGGQSFTGTVRTTGRRGGRCSIAADGKFTRIELGELESVVVATDNELTMPSGRTVRSAHLTGEALGTLRIL